MANLDAQLNARVTDNGPDTDVHLEPLAEPLDNHFQASRNDLARTETFGELDLINSYKTPIESRSTEALAHQPQPNTRSHGSIHADIVDKSRLLAETAEMRGWNLERDHLLARIQVLQVT
jgi:hypothetical protein